MATLAMVAGGLTVDTVFAQPENELLDRRVAVTEQTDSSLAADGRNIKLRFFNTTWSRVLQDVCEQSGTTLVMDKLPPGRWTHGDRGRHSLAECIGIFNHELEPKGFRVIRKGDFVVVLEMKAVRSRYYHKVLPAQEPDEASQTASPAAASEFRKPQRKFETLIGRETPAAHRPRSEVAHDRSIRQVGHELPSLTGASSQSQRILKTVPLQQKRATDVARRIYEAYREKSKLIDAGPQGLPAFNVFESIAAAAAAAPNADAAGVLFSVGIDQRNNALVIEAAEEDGNRLAKVVRTFDLVDPEPGQVLQLVSASTAAGTIVEQLKPQMKRVQMAQLPNPRIAQNPGASNTSGQNAPVQPDPGAAGQPAGEEPFDPSSIIIDTLRGNVDVEVVPGGLILRGNQVDIEALMKVINQIETFSQGAVPDINLIFVKNVNSEALAQLLTTVYERLNELRGRGTDLPETIGFIPVVRPNAILVLAPDNDMESILELADELDRPVDPATEFEVFYLNHAVASQVATSITEFYPEQDENSVGLRQRVAVFADVRTNTLVVRARPNDLTEIAALIRKMDRAATPAVNRVRMFTLKHAVAEELSEVINNTIQSLFGPPGQTTTTGVGGGGFGAQQQLPEELRAVRSLALEFLQETEDGEELVRSGILADVRVTTDVRTNSLIVSAPEASMKLMSALIMKLDQPSSTVAEIKVFTLENSDATAMAELLTALFESDQQGVGGQNQQQIGVQIAGAEDVSSSLVPLRFSVDVRTNTIVAVGGADALRVVEAILLRLDESDMRRRQNTVIKLKNSPVTDVANAINAFLTSQRELAQLDPELVSNVELLEREVIVVPETVSNSLLISATPSYYEEIMKVVDKLDEAPPQVIIQALLVEVVLDNVDEFGVELGFQDSVLFTRSLLENIQLVSQTRQTAGNEQVTTQTIVSQEATPGFLFNNTQLGNNTAPGVNINPGKVGTQGLSNFSLGRINGDLGFGGLVLAASSDSVNLLLRALSSQRTVNILSRPQIRTVDNQFSQIVVGQTIQWVSNFQQNAVTGGFTPLTTPRDVGIILEVTPRISPEGTIVIEARAEKSALSEQGVPLVFDPTTGTQIESPIIDVTTAQATIAIPDGQTAVMGGMITKRDAITVRKVPHLGDIPILGIPFRFESTQTLRTELLIFLTPRIIRDDEDNEMIKQVEAERMHFIVEDAESLHGPLYSLPADMQGMPLNGQPTPIAPPPAPGLMEDDSFEGDVPTSSVNSENAHLLVPAAGPDASTQQDSDTASATAPQGSEPELFPQLKPVN